MGSGEAVQAILGGTLEAARLQPGLGGATCRSSTAPGCSQAGHTKPISPAGEPLVLSPVVIAMWKPMAEALGWPQKAARAGATSSRSAPTRRAGARYGHPEWGRFKLGHTHPEFSNSGLLVGARRGLRGREEDARAHRRRSRRPRPIATFVSRRRGDDRPLRQVDRLLRRQDARARPGVPVGRGALREPGHRVVRQEDRAPFPLVAIYPVEGTFWSDHPYAVLDAPWVGPDEREAAQAVPRVPQGQARSRSARSRSASAPPTRRSRSARRSTRRTASTRSSRRRCSRCPTAPTLEALLALWRENKKAGRRDRWSSTSRAAWRASRSPRPRPGAKAFLDTLGDRDEVTLALLRQQALPADRPVHARRRTARSSTQRIDGVIADGGTALYDADRRRPTTAAMERADKRARRASTRWW